MEPIAAWKTVSASLSTIAEFTGTAMFLSYSETPMGNWVGTKDHIATRRKDIGS
jgi:hypothetical protein